MNLGLIEIINKVKEKITDDSNMVWTHYDNAKQLRDELDATVEKLKLGDKSALEELNNLFLPTAALQEHSISNGWPDDYLNLAEKFDNLYSMIKTRS